jgi:8-oxo-dGTP pyrophosphatase MutT (NUDIX family)
VAAFPSVGELERALAGREEPHYAGVAAAVALLVRDRGAGTELVLARRAERLGDPWSGHMSLPGGRIEHVDATPLETARRETLEEVGFDPLREGRLLGALDVVPGRSNVVLVAPFVVAIESDVDPAVSAELQAAWWARAADLVEREVRVPELPFPVPAFVGTGPDGREAVVWGMTHRLLVGARAVALV